MTRLLKMMLVVVFVLSSFPLGKSKSIYANEPQEQLLKTPEERGMLPRTTIEESELARKLMNMSDAQLRKLEEGKERGLLELRPVVLPEEKYILDENDHFGWPVATRAGDALVVIYLRRKCHYGETPRFNQDSSGCMMTRSLDGGQSWSLPRDLREFARQEDGSLPFYSKGECITTTSDGAIVLGHEVGTFRSEDQGVTWEHFDYQFGRTLVKGHKKGKGERTTLNCPRLLEHPEYGLVRMAGIKISWMGHLEFGDKMHVAYSQDGGRTWQEQKHKVPITAPSEPAMLLHNGALIMIGRANGHRGSASGKYVQLWSKTGWFPLHAEITDMRVDTLDTVDIALNPVTQRFEVVATNRSGGGEGRTQDANFTLNLYSIDPEALLSGSADWRFEGSLFERRSPQLPVVENQFGDGCHPAASVIDEKEGVQHIFVYMGRQTGPSGIFHLTRTLDTPKLAAFLKN